MNCVIIDDEPAAISVLEDYVAKLPKQLKLMASFLNPIEAFEYIQNNEVDLVFLDVNMPTLSGISFLELLKGKCQTILTTAYTEYALEGYKYEITDYLTKPIPFDVFLKAIKKAENRLKTKENVQNIVHTTNNSQDFILVKTDHKGKFAKIPYADILFIESMRNYVAIYTVQKEQIISLLSMKELDAYLPASKFIRTHKSYILALGQIKLIDGGEIILKDAKDKIPLGATYREAFFKVLENSMLNG